MVDIKTLAEEVTEGFSLVESPKILESGEKEKMLETNGRYHPPIFPSIIRAFPVMFLSNAQMDNLAHMENYFQSKSGLGCVNRVQFPMNAQQHMAVNTMFKIETAGALVDSLKKYSKGEDSVIWNYRISRLPTDTPDNGFITKMMNWMGDFDALGRLEKDEFTIEQLKNMPPELVQGAFYQTFGDEIKRIVLDYHGALSDLRQTAPDAKEYESVIRSYFQSCRKLYEEGTNAIRQLEDTSLITYPTWIVSDGDDINEGDYIQGIFVDGKQYICAEGNVTHKKDDKNGIYFGLENASKFCDGKGKGRLEDLLLSKEFWYPRVWKFEAGTTK